MPEDYVGCAWSWGVTIHAWAAWFSWCDHPAWSGVSFCPPLQPPLRLPIRVYEQRGCQVRLCWDSNWQLSFTLSYHWDCILWAMSVRVHLPMAEVCSACSAVHLVSPSHCCHSTGWVLLIHACAPRAVSQHTVTLLRIRYMTQGSVFASVLHCFCQLQLGQD